MKLRHGLNPDQTIWTIIETSPPYQPICLQIPNEK